jgi:hypothetical protein
MAASDWHDAAPDGVPAPQPAHRHHRRRPSGAAEIGGLEAEVEAGIEGFTPEQLCEEFDLPC